MISDRNTDKYIAVLYISSNTGRNIISKFTNQAKCGSFRFSAVGIPVGATIHYINDESIIATVLDDCHISYKGVTTSMSAVAAELLNVEGTIQGILHMRDRIEEKR